MDQARFRTTLTSFYSWVDQHSGGALGVFRLALQRFNTMRGSEAAAGVAYYAIFSVIPLMLLLAAIIGFILASAQVPARVIAFITQAIPPLRAVVGEYFYHLLENRNIGGIVGGLGLIWAASGVFITLSRNLDRAWPDARERNYVQGRLLSLGVLAMVFLLLILWLVVTSILDRLPEYEAQLQGRVAAIDSVLLQVFSFVAPWVVAFLLFLGLYHWLPNTTVQWREAFWGALVATLAWELTTQVFTWYVYSPFARYQVLYGPLGTGLALLTWVYLTAWITLFGAHLSAAVALSGRLRNWSHPTQKEIEQSAK